MTDGLSRVLDAEGDRGPVPLDQIHPKFFERLADAVLSRAIHDLDNVQHRAAARRWLLFDFHDSVWAEFRPALRSSRLAEAVLARCQAPTRRNGKH